MGIKVMGLNLGYMGGDKELLVFPHPNYILHSQRREGAKTWCRIPATVPALGGSRGQDRRHGSSTEWCLKVRHIVTTCHLATMYNHASCMISYISQSEQQR